MTSKPSTPTPERIELVKSSIWPSDSGKQASKTVPPLAGVRVLELAGWRPVSYATQLLTDDGADTIKIEPPGGDPMRTWPALFDRLNAGKRSVCLDLKDPADAERARELAGSAHVIVEGLRPGSADRMGLGYDDIARESPAVVYVSVSGFGATGPLANLPGHDINYQALGGALLPGDGGQPVQSPVAIADLAAGLAAAFAASSALLRAWSTGVGAQIDLAMADVMATWAGTLDRFSFTGMEPSRDGVAGYGVFETADREWIALGVVTEDHFWQRLCQTLELGDQMEQARLDQRLEHATRFNDAIGAAIATHRRDELVGRLQAADVPATPVLARSELSANPHLRTRGAIIDAADGGAVAGWLARLAGETRPDLARPPACGEHQDAIWRPQTDPYTSEETSR